MPPRSVGPWATWHQSLRVSRFKCLLLCRFLGRRRDGVGHARDSRRRRNLHRSRPQALGVGGAKRDANRVRCRSHSVAPHSWDQTANSEFVDGSRDWLNVGFLIASAVGPRGLSILTRLCKNSGRVTIRSLNRGHGWRASWLGWIGHRRRCCRNALKIGLLRTIQSCRVGSRGAIEYRRTRVPTCFYILVDSVGDKRLIPNRNEADSGDSHEAAGMILS
jgi:hypothetical protein